jgi:hypothetical protein
VAQAVNHHPLTVEARFRTRVSPYRIYGRQSGTGTSISPSSSISPCQIPFRHCSPCHTSPVQRTIDPQFRDILIPHRHYHKRYSVLLFMIAILSIIKVTNWTVGWAVGFKKPTAALLVKKSAPPPRFIKCEDSLHICLQWAVILRDSVPPESTPLSQITFLVLLFSYCR